MLTCNYSKEILNNQGVKVKKIDETEKEMQIHIELPRKKCVCPICGKEIDKIHNYRMQVIKQLPAFGKAVRLILRKRRYVCDRGKRFAEEISFLSKYQRTPSSYGTVEPLSWQGALRVSARQVIRLHPEFIDCSECEQHLPFALQVLLKERNISLYLHTDTRMTNCS